VAFVDTPWSGFFNPLVARSSSVPMLGTGALDPAMVPTLDMLVAFQFLLRFFCGGVITLNPCATNWKGSSVRRT